MSVAVVQFIKAASEGDLRSVRDMIGRGADINGRDPNLGNSALGEAAAYGHLKVINLLLESGADVDAPSYSDATPLMLASYHGRRDSVQLLIMAGANVNHAKEKTGETALHWAALRAHQEVARLLLEAGASANTAARHNVGAEDFPWLEVCGETPFHYAAAYGGPELLGLMLEAGADPTIRTAGETPLQWGRLLRREGTVKKLLDGLRSAPRP